MQGAEAAFHGTCHLYCMKHNKHCSNRVQWMINRFHDSLFPQKYSYKFFRLICTCPSNDYQSLENPWENVLSRHLIASVMFIDSYISQNIGNAQADVLNEVMKHLRRLLIVPKEQDMAEMDPEVNRMEDCRTSAFKMFYLIQKAIEGDYSMLEPPRQNQSPVVANDKILTFVMESFKHENIGHVIGVNGNKLIDFLKRYRCYVKFDKIPFGDGFKVQATIKKAAASEQTLEAIKKNLIIFAMHVQDENNAYEEEAREKLEERRNKFTELLKQTEGMGPNAEWNTILNEIEGNEIYEDIKNVEFETQTQWFEHVKTNWHQITESDRDSTVGADGGLDPSNDTSQPSSLDQAVFVPSVVNNLVASRSPGDPSSPTKPPIESGASSVSNTISSNPRRSQSVSVGTNTMPLQSTSLCIVHDRRWVPTFQYFLYQCYTQIQMPKKYGYPMSKLICTCDNQETGTSKYYPIKSDIDTDFKNVYTILGMWPEEQKTILQPLFRQLEKAHVAETYPSLVKLVFYFKAMKRGDFAILSPGAKLPGDSHQCNFCNSPTCSVLARNKTLTNQGGNGLSSADSLNLSSLASGPRTRSPANTAEETAKKSPPTSTAAEKTEILPYFQPKTRTIRKVNVSDWIDDCYFHGKKKKFVFQCIVNYLHQQAFLPVSLNIAFSMAVCCCGENVVFEDYYRSNFDLLNDCKFMKEKLTAWRGDSKTSIQPYIALLDQYIENKQITDGFMKFVCFFKRAFTRDLYVISEIDDQMKRHKK